ncbi:MAG TPA: ribonuclease III domain-containing protein, partial [bacterium]|nr:ribonuclease III domain-containing protein [bacterium]
HPSVVEDLAQSYELYEFMGDAMIDVVVIEDLVRRHPDEIVGNLAKAKSRVVSTTELAAICQELDLVALLRYDAKQNRGREVSTGIRADLYEALIGAVFLDRGYAAARKLLKSTLQATIQVDIEARKAEDFKSLLQERVQSLFKEVPTYHVVTTTGPEHDKVFRVVATFRGIPLAQGRGHSKKEAEQDSARKTMLQFERYFHPFLEEGMEWED